MDCRQCMYFKKAKNMMKGGTIIVGFCNLRQKHISDETVNMEQCKDRAILMVDEKEKDNTETVDDFVKRAAFG